MLTNRSSSGAVLIIVLILSAIIYLAVSTVLLMTMMEIHLADFERRSSRAFYLAESAIVLGVARLRTNPDNLALFSETVPGTLNAFNVTFTPKLYDEHESWYHLLLDGEGVISGPTASATRRVRREILQKPFTLFAREQIELRELCRITGNIHANQGVDIGPQVKVEGHISSSLSEPVIADDAVIPDDEKPALEPEMTFPLIPQSVYRPKYLYKGQEYEMQTLSLTSSIALSSDAPAELLNVYRGTADLLKNPVGVFLLNDEIDDEANGTLTVLDIQGGSVILASSNPFRLRGLVRISPVEHFPALLKFDAGETSFELISFEELKDFLDVSNPEVAKLPQKNHIEGLLYSLGSILLTAESGSVTIDGSIWANTIVLKGNATCAVDFGPTLMTNPPPGLKVIDYLEWRELLE